MKTFLYSVFILLLAPCNSGKKATTTASDNSKLEIVYQRTACFGKCPIYTLTINGSTKTATFKGEQNTDKIGTFSKSMTDDELTQLVNAFESANFNSLNDDYLGTITDFPMVLITYSNKGKTKRIRDRSDAPAELHTLEKILNEFSDTTEGWKKSDTADH